jgi:uracil-DNA glycosylase
MSLLLDPRQRAMLREMGVRVWQPALPISPPMSLQSAIDVIAVDARTTPAATQTSLNPPVSVAQVAAPVVPLAMRAVPAPVPRAADVQTAAPAAGWHIANGRALYPPQATSATRWLVLAETPAGSLRDDGFDPLAGESGELLDKMLRAAKLPQAALALLLPIARLSATAPHDPALIDALAARVAQARPDIVLIMGRLAAQAVLQTGDPLGKLRGRVHKLAALQNVPTVVTYEAAYLLRNPADKGKAWEDLKLAMASIPNPSPY